MQKGDKCIVLMPDGTQENAIWWEELGGHIDVEMWGRKICITPECGWLIRPA